MTRPDAWLVALIILLAFAFPDGGIWASATRPSP